MDLGLAGRRALVLASSRGLGLACATALAREGCAVTLNARHQTGLDEAAEGIAAAHGTRPATVASFSRERAASRVGRLASQSSGRRLRCRASRMPATCRVEVKERGWLPVR